MTPAGPDFSRRIANFRVVAITLVMDEAGVQGKECVNVMQDSRVMTAVLVPPDSWAKIARKECPSAVDMDILFLTKGATAILVSRVTTAQNVLRIGLANTAT